MDEVDRVNRDSIQMEEQEADKTRSSVTQYNREINSTIQYLDHMFTFKQIFDHLSMAKLRGRYNVTSVEYGLFTFIYKIYENINHKGVIELDNFVALDLSEDR